MQSVYSTTSGNWAGCFSVISWTIVVWGSNPSAEMQSVYSTTSSNWAGYLSVISRTLVCGGLTSLQRCSRCIPVTIPLRPPHVHVLTIHFLAGDQLVVPRGVTHISYHYKNTIEGVGGKRTNEQNEQYAWG